MVYSTAHVRNNPRGEMCSSKHCIQGRRQLGASGAQPPI